jgi:hypothetical protein
MLPLEFHESPVDSYSSTADDSNGHTPAGQLDPPITYIFPFEAAAAARSLPVGILAFGVHGMTADDEEQNAVCAQINTISDMYFLRLEPIRYAIFHQARTFKP